MNKDTQIYIEANTKLELVRDILYNIQWPEDDDVLKNYLDDVPALLIEVENHCFRKIQEDV